MPPDSIVTRIEPVSERDLAVAIEMMARFFREEGFDTDPRVIADNVGAMTKDAGCWVAMATEAGTPAGIVTVSTMFMVEQGRLAEIGDLYVLPEFRGRRLGRRMVDAAIAWSRGKGCTGVYVTLTLVGESRHGLSRFYQRLQFQSTGRTIMTMDFNGH